MRREKGASIVFLVKDYRTELYTAASKFLQDSNNVASFNGGDFSTLIKEQYEKIKGQVTLKLKNKDELGLISVSEIR